MSRTLIAIDPGGTTGFVVVNFDLQVIESQEITDWYAVPARVEDYFAQAVELGQEHPAVVAESFHITGQTHKKSRQNEPMDILGAVRYLYHRNTGKVLPTQTPSDAKNFSTNDKLKRLGFWHKGGQGHANDAYRHALLYLVRHKLVPTSLLVDD